jgi:TfoX-like protein
LAGREEAMKPAPQNKYLDRITTLVSLARPKLSQTHDLEYKNCFGAVAGCIEGQIFISCGKFGVALKLPPKTIAKLSKESDVKPLKYFPKGHVKKDYAVLPRRILEDKSQFKKLIERSIRFVMQQQ